MGTVEKRDKHKKRRFVSPEEKLERELKDCMHCRFFWGHNNRCANGTCCKPSKKKEQKLPTECVGCPYYQGNGYCFPCMRKLIGKYAADLEFGRKAQLRRQLVALLQLSAADLLEHVVHDLLVIDAGFRFHCDTSLSNIHKFCVDFLRIVFIYKEKKEWYD